MTTPPKKKKRNILGSQTSSDTSKPSLITAQQVNEGHHQAVQSGRVHHHMCGTSHMWWGDGSSYLTRFRTVVIWVKYLLGNLKYLKGKKKHSSISIRTRWAGRMINGSVNSREWYLQWCTPSLHKLWWCCGHD